MHQQQDGFSLIELSLVLLILTLLSGSLVNGLALQRETVRRNDLQTQLTNIREALLAHAIVYGRLPCPARPTIPSGDTNSGREDCTLSSGHGVLPWATLGLPETDPWGQRFTYYAQVAFSTSPAAGALSGFSLDTLGNANIQDATGHDIASELPAVIVSHGPRGAGGYTPAGSQVAGAAGDEAENADADTRFVSRMPDEQFDDMLSWLTSAVLKARMVAAGKLP